MNTTQVLLTILLPAVLCGLAAFPIFHWILRLFWHQNIMYLQQISLQQNNPVINAGKAPEQNNPDRPISIEHVKPFIEEQVDHFMNNKLQELFPLLVKFMGDKTKQQFRQAFLNETERLFPSVIKVYLDQEKQASNPSSENMDVPNKPNSSHIMQLQEYVRLRFVMMMFTTGLLIGLMVFLCLSVSF